MKKNTSVAKPKANLKSVSSTADSTQPEVEFTTVRLSKRLHKSLSLISIHDDKTIFDVTELAVDEYVKRWKKISGKSL